MLTSEIISIGSELLNGFTLNSNAHWIAQKFNELGYKTIRMTSIEDQKDDIFNILSEAKQRKANIVVCTGGLGPTLDDITKACIAEYFESPLETDADTLVHIERIFSKKGVPMVDINRFQALIPKNSIALFNEYGTAPGIWLAKNDQVFIFLPGVPYEMRNIFETQVMPRIRTNHEAKVRYQTITTRGIGESSLMVKIQDWEKEALVKQLDLAYYPSPKTVKLRLSKYTQTQEEFDAVVKPMVISLKQLIPENFVVAANFRLEELVAQKLLSKKQTLCTVESCTGGYISHLITTMPGSSAYFNGSIVSYQNNIKSHVVGVNFEHFNTVGAVSEEVVLEMAQKGRLILESDYCVSTSGIAGPTGATDTKPVGLVWIAVATPSKVVAKKFQFGKDRKNNIQLFAQYALDFLLTEMS